MLKKNGNGNRYKLILNPVRAIKMQHEIGFTCIMLNDKVTNKRVKKTMRIPWTDLTIA